MQYQFIPQEYQHLEHWYIKFAKQRYGAHKSITKNQPRKDKLGNLIEFKMTFEEWFKIWHESGHFLERGNKRGEYCMSRYHDIGHYEVGNVFIQLTTSNTSQACKGHKWTEEACKAASLQRKGKKQTKVNKDPDITCILCRKTTTPSNFYQYHGENCNHNPDQIKVTCPKCNKTGGKNQMHRFHFDRCTRRNKEGKNNTPTTSRPFSKKALKNVKEANKKRAGKRSKQKVIFMGVLYESLTEAIYCNNTTRHLILKHPSFKRL